MDTSFLSTILRTRTLSKVCTRLFCTHFWKLNPRG